MLNGIITSNVNIEHHLTRKLYSLLFLKFVD